MLMAFEPASARHPKELGTQTYGSPLLSLLLRGVFLSWMRVTELTA
jgi:hypothetical protein